MPAHQSRVGALLGLGIGLRLWELPSSPSFSISLKQARRETWLSFPSLRAPHIASSPAPSKEGARCRTLESAMLEFFCPMSLATEARKCLVSGLQCPKCCLGGGARLLAPTYTTTKPNSGTWNLLLCHIVKALMPAQIGVGGGQLHNPHPSPQRPGYRYYSQVS